MPVAPDLPMQVKKTKDKNDFSFTLISDQNHELAQKLGLAFKLDDDTLPMPGTYVIDTKGQVVYAYVDPNYKKRAEPLEVLEVVEGIQAEE